MSIELRTYNEKAYKVLNGTWYDENTLDTVIYHIDKCMHTSARVRLFYGDTTTGRSWEEENDVTGTIGRSTGIVKIPLLIANSRSMGGGGILDHCIVKMMVNGCVVYQHSMFYQPVYRIDKPGAICKDHPEYTVGVYDDEGNVANFRSEAQALRWIDFMTGRRMNK